MSGYTKLFSSIIYSTIWREPDNVRIVWITMLALCNADGDVEASIPGLADASRVSIEQTEDALLRLMSPDRYSRSQDYEGRRIEVIDGGWKVLNYCKYRGKLTCERVREQGRLRQKRFREKSKISNGAVTGNADVTPINAYTEAEAEAEATTTKSVVSVIPKDSVKKKDEFDQFWACYPRKIGKKAAHAAWKRAKDKPEISQILATLDMQRKSREWTAENGQYIPHPATWINQGRWDDVVDSCAQQVSSVDDDGDLIISGLRRFKSDD